MKRFLTVILTLMLLSLSCIASGKGKEFKLLYWNIQNGMWHDQGNGYDGFVKFVKELDPDICVWCEAESRYVTDKAVKMQMPEDQYLPWNWDILAARYGHKYTLVCGKRDTFPQVITSKYPIKIVRRITGNGEDIIVVHGAGWAKVDLGKAGELNLVTLHTWPQRYAYLAEDQKADAAAQGGDVFRHLVGRQLPLWDGPFRQGFPGARLCAEQYSVYRRYRALLSRRVLQKHLLRKAYRHGVCHSGPFR